VVDYRGTNPVVHVIAPEYANDPEVKPSVRCSATLTGITKPLFGLFSGMRTRLGPVGRINTGYDTQNHAFKYSQADIAAALDAATKSDDLSKALVMGFGATHARKASAAPTLEGPKAVSVALGKSVTLTASADDADEGDLSDKIEWVERPTAYHLPVRGYGGEFVYTPTQLGKHVVELSVTDASGQRASTSVEVQVTGTLPIEKTARFADDIPHGKRATVTADGLGVYFGEEGGFKDGIRLNQGLLGDFWYFEATRGETYSMGVGLTTADADLDFYSTIDTPWSMSVNVLAGVWRDLVDVGNIDTGSGEAMSSEASAAGKQTRYGFAVDYRGATPVVYVVTGVNATARLIARVPMPNIHVPVYPFVYSGEGSGGGSAAMPALTLKLAAPFGFTNVAQAIVTPPADGSVEAAKPADAAALKLGWGTVR
jgi:hypothetical protein